MELNEKAIKEISAIAIIILFAILVFFTIRPVLFAVLWGLIFGYIFLPVYRRINKYVRNRTAAASITLFIAILIIAIPLWIITPLLTQQVFEVYRSSQNLNVYGLVHQIFPTASPQFSSQLAGTINTVISKVTSAVMSSMVNVFTNFLNILMNIGIMGFVFFFTLRDNEKLKEFILRISPINRLKQKQLAKGFSDITYSTIYGRIVVGVVQGIFAGVGFWLFGVHNTLVLSVIAVFLAVLPFVGVFLLWIPLAIFMLLAGNIGTAIAFILYNAIIVSNIDNLLLSLIIAKKTNLSTPFALISSIGGLLLFGIIGLILGPLIFAYFLILMDWYKENNLLSLFSKDESTETKKEDIIRIA